MEHLYNYIFHYNHHTELWYAIPRENYVDYFNGNHDNCAEDTTVEGVLTKVFLKESLDDLPSN